MNTFLWGKRALPHKTRKCKSPDHRSSLNYWSRTDFVAINHYCDKRYKKYSAKKRSGNVRLLHIIPPADLLVFISDWRNCMIANIHYFYFSSYFRPFFYFSLSLFCFFFLFKTYFERAFALKKNWIWELSYAKAFESDGREREVHDLHSWALVFFKSSLKKG